MDRSANRTFLWVSARPELQGNWFTFFQISSEIPWHQNTGRDLMKYNDKEALWKGVLPGSFYCEPDAGNPTTNFTTDSHWITCAFLHINGRVTRKLFFIVSGSTHGQWLFERNREKEQMEMIWYGRKWVFLPQAESPGESNQWTHFIVKNVSQTLISQFSLNGQGDGQFSLAISLLWQRIHLYGLTSQ